MFSFFRRKFGRNICALKRFKLLWQLSWKLESWTFLWNQESVFTKSGWRWIGPESFIPQQTHKYYDHIFFWNQCGSLVVLLRVSTSVHVLPCVCSFSWNDRDRKNTPLPSLGYLILSWYWFLFVFGLLGPRKYHPDCYLTWCVSMQQKTLRASTSVLNISPDLLKHGAPTQ